MMMRMGARSSVHCDSAWPGDNGLCLSGPGYFHWWLVSAARPASGAGPHPLGWDWPELTARSHQPRLQTLALGADNQELGAEHVQGEWLIHVGVVMTCVMWGCK